MFVNYAEIEAITKELHAKFENVPKQIRILRLEHQLCDQEISDILHCIEFSTFNAAEGYKLSRELQITLEKRREIKNELTSLCELKQTLNANDSIKERIVRINKKISKRNKVILSKKYTPRVRIDLQERFDKCYKSKVIEMRG